MPPRIGTAAAALPGAAPSRAANPSMPKGGGARAFSRSARLATRQRSAMWAWINGAGRQFRRPAAGTTNYLGGGSNWGGQEEGEEGADAGGRQRYNKFPFPRNRHFQSLPVLSEELRDGIWDMVVNRGMSVREVSARMLVGVERVGAVARMKEVERRWEKEGKRLAHPYANAILSMLPQTPYKPVGGAHPHEPINDLPVHQATGTQLFHPTSESRPFTRADAGRAFAPSLLPADQRIPHPELIARERVRLAGGSAREARAAEQEAASEADKLAEEKEKKERETREAQTRTVRGRRWDFKFREVNADEVAGNERSPKGVGWRYGFPHEDRKKGQVKIATKVE
ncbi:eukaryotic mitochondrial regulator protein-domain-containing protein [Lineolata rhizophorae]|uniref:Eukaryotic mitochondrial regulator protein-domain-containing protein n=1 Tax=Lineolata rhizophorae TaxID=578093 RepID=A0A6A6NQU8_9PEZI|nr:eukaryotic mitochondrial regulator protein-domain-containing protein [Lineolata rhizophorae]